MQRISALWQASPNKLVGALFALTLAAMMAVASGASFTSTSANVGNIVTAGNLSHSNSETGMILSVDKLMPGESGSGMVTIGNDGDVDGLFTLSQSDLDDSDDTNPLSENLELTVRDITGTPVQIYQGTIADMDEQDMGDIDAGANRTYEFTVRFPDGGTPTGPDAGDNRYKGDSVTVDYHWESVAE